MLYFNAENEIFHFLNALIVDILKVIVKDWQTHIQEREEKV